MTWIEEYRKTYPKREARADAEGLWVLWNPSKGYLTVHESGTVVFKNYEFIAFNDRKSAQSYRPDVRLHHKLEAMQVLVHGFHIVADIISVNTQRTASDLPLTAISQEYAIWAREGYASSWGEGANRLSFAIREQAQATMRLMHKDADKIAAYVPNYIAKGTYTNLRVVDSVAYDCPHWSPKTDDILDVAAIVEPDKRVIDLDGGLS
jgi:hypothetical protein